MDLLERYLQAIGQSLSPATREDVLNELRANLAAQIDDRAEELNRPITESELAALLRTHGRPEVVAARYLPQRYLIGPTLFPFYLLTMRRVLPFVVAIYFIANLIKIAVTQNGLGSIAEGLVDSAFQLIPVIFVWLGVMTILFAILERTYDQFGKAWNLDNWNPSKLPPVKPSDGIKQRSLASRIADLAFHCLWMAYVIEVPRHPYLMFGPAVSFIANLQVTWAPVWHTFYVAFWFLLLVQLGIKIANLFSALGRWRIPLDLIAKLYSIALTGWLASAGTYVIATGPGIDPLQLAITNHWVALSIAIVLIFMVLDLAVQAWKYVRGHIPIARLAF
jgi:hypothetical protein